MFSSRPLAAGMLIVVLAAACGGRSPAQLANDELEAGLAAVQSGDRPSAVAHYEACLRHEPQNKYCLYNLGVHAGLDGRIDEAQTYYENVLVIDPNFPNAIFNLGVIARDRGELDGAGDFFRRYILLVPDDPDGHLSLGLILRRLGQTTEAEAELAEAQRLDPQLVIPSVPPSEPPQTPAATP